MNFHQQTAYDMAKQLRTMLEALPTAKFPDLREQSMYQYENGGSQMRVLTVARMLPSRKMADVQFYGEDQTQRITPSRYYGIFRELNDEIKKWLGVTHENVIDSAITEGLSIPARVRVHYPDKFVELPERFSVKQLQDVLRPSWGKFVTAETVAEMIEQRHQSIRKMDLELPKVAVLNPAHIQDYERYIAGYNTDIDFYRWLQPLVAEGGVFCIENGPESP